MLCVVRVMQTPSHDLSVNRVAGKLGYGVEDRYSGDRAIPAGQKPPPNHGNGEGRRSNIVTRVDDIIT